MLIPLDTVDEFIALVENHRGLIAEDTERGLGEMGKAEGFGFVANAMD